ncbi:hypothetical protein [Methylobacterium sp. WL120]|uniref:hypothetical protein n=1 Tax=Methylobacterium sp. WL120 TaxID=2603887 RepID=UPI001FEF7E71|nr:hypothetical protein [Methylobacterium sp. WL120]
MQTWILVSEIVRNAGLALAAFGGVILAWWTLTPELARRAHVTELFNRAAGQLGDERLEVRLAAIYVLREIGRDFSDLANPVFELLQAILRERQADYRDLDPPVDVQAIMATLRMRIADDDKPVA